ncbi:hypothetical protein H0H92_009077 [Tricholoma furcatifolium]|nr:hypothetical protein H0H92_009077 [Tricholoma furcatifolium]
MSDDEVPPPYSERELDQKISRALAISAQVQQPQVSQQSSNNDGEWEQWDDAVFALAEARSAGLNGSDLRGSSSTNASSRIQVPHATPLPVPSAVQPLRVHKRANSKSSSSAGWTGGNRDGLSSPGSSASGHAIWQTPQSRHEIPLSDDEEDDRSVPPPPFASVGTRMDGIVRLEYHPESTPPSPLNSPLSDDHLSFPVAPPTTTGPPLSTLPLPRPVTPQRSPRQSLPAPPRSPNYHLEQRPLSTFHPRQGTVSSQIHTELPRTHEHFRQNVPPIPPFQPSSQIASFSAYSKTGQTLPATQPSSFAAGAFYK